jgi:PAS domain S-box-containing protein
MSEEMEEMLFLSTFLSGAKPIDILKQVFTRSISPLLVTSAGNLDGGYKIIYANRAFCRLTGYDLAELVGNSPRMFQGPKSNRETLNKLSIALKTTGYFRGMSYNYRKDGTCYPLEWDISPIQDEDGKTIFFVSIQRDLTQALKTARQIKDMSEHVRELISDVSHGKVAPEELKAKSKPLIEELKDSAKLYSSTSEDEDDVFFDLDDDFDLDGDADDQAKSQTAISASEYLIEERLSEAEIFSMLECITDVEEEINSLTSNPSQKELVTAISEELRELSDNIFFLVEFTDTALAINKVADCLPSFSEQQLAGFGLEFLQSLIVEIENWVKDVFVSKSANNIYDGANNIIASSKQITSMAQIPST